MSEPGSSERAVLFRCAKCQDFLAGPVTEEAAGPGWTDRGTNVSRVRLGSFVRRDDGIYLHPFWSRSWAESWRGDGREEVPDTIPPANPKSLRGLSFGCCGPDGDVVCAGDHVVGRVQGDCWHEHWLRLVPSLVQSSVDPAAQGPWILFDFSEKAPIRITGEFRNGARHGEWTFEREVRRAGPGRVPSEEGKGRWRQTTLEVVEYEVCRMARYRDGQLVEEVDTGK